MAATQTPSSARELQGPLFGLLLLLLLLRLLLSLLRLQEANTMLQERILKLDEDMTWWKKRCKKFQGEYDRRHAALRTGDCHVRISSSLTQNVAWTILHTPYTALGWCESACPICKRPLELTVWGANLQSKTHESGGPAQHMQLSAWKGPQEAKKVYKGARAYAYCAVLWGASAGYALGALVLGARLRELGAKSGRVSPDLVLLYTNDVPLNYRMLLSKIWTLKRVAYIHGVAALYHQRVAVSMASSQS